MKKGDLVRLSIRGSISLGMASSRDETKYGTGVFLEWIIHSKQIANVYWLGGCGLTRTHIDFFEKIT